MEPDPKWLTVSEVALILGVSTETVRNMIKRGELPASRASNRKRAAFLIDADEWERQRARDAERAATRQRLVGVVTGRGEEFFEQVEQQHGPATAEHLRERSAEHDLFERLQSEMATDPGFQARIRELDDAERIEAKAQELARRIREDEKVRDRAREILDEEDAGNGD
jgi:excisionase family DNA binding protein